MPATDDDTLYIGVHFCPYLSICIIGKVKTVYQIWTLKHQRRKGIAHHLVNIARDKLMYGMRIDKPQIAFSSPTGEGIKFAKNYMGEKHNVLVYDC